MVIYQGISFLSRPSSMIKTIIIWLQCSSVGCEAAVHSLVLGFGESSKSLKRGSRMQNEAERWSRTYTTTYFPAELRLNPNFQRAVLFSPTMPFMESRASVGSLSPLPPSVPARPGSFSNHSAVDWIGAAAARVRRTPHHKPSAPFPPLSYCHLAFYVNIGLLPRSEIETLTVREC